MQYRDLGATGLSVSVIAFGAGPVPALLTQDRPTAQRDTIAAALELGVNWFDTAPTYGAGKSESSLGAALAELAAANRVHVATKVRLPGDQLGNIRQYVRQSVEKSLQRLRLPRVTLLQLHNSITTGRDDEPTSITPRDVLVPGGVLEAFQAVRDEGLVDHFGLTGLGNAASLVEVLDSGAFATMQVVYNLLNPSAGFSLPRHFGEVDYALLIDRCAKANVAVVAIRAMAGGALAGRPPSEHTLTTKFFPLDLYQRDQQTARRLIDILPNGQSLPEVAVRFVVSDPRVATVLLGVASTDEIRQAARFAAAGPLSPDVIAQIATAAWNPGESNEE